MVELIVWLAALDYHGPIRHRPCESKIEHTAVYDRTVDGRQFTRDGRPVRVAVDEASDKRK